MEHSQYSNENFNNYQINSNSINFRNCIHNDPTSPFPKLDPRFPITENTNNSYHSLSDQNFKFDNKDFVKVKEQAEEIMKKDAGNFNFVLYYDQI